MTTIDPQSETLFLDCAVEIAQTVESRSYHSELLSVLATRYAEAGSLDVAVELTENVSDLYTRDQVRGNIAALCVAAGAVDYANQLLDSIEDDSVYAVAMEQVAVKYAESGDLETGVAVATDLADSAPTLSQIALISADQGFFAQALDLARSLEEADLQALTLVELARKALHEERQAEALDLLSEADGVIEEIEGSPEQIAALVAIAALYKESAQDEQAFATLVRARQLSDEIADPTPSYASNILNKDSAYLEVARGFAQLQQYEQADLAIEEIEHPVLFVRATLAVALEYHKAAMTTEALASLNQADELCRDDEVTAELSQGDKESLVGELARGYATLGHFDEALRTADLLTRREMRHWTLRAIALLCATAGNNDKAFQVAEAIEEIYPRVECLLELAAAFSRAEQLEPADHALAEALAKTADIEVEYEKTLALMEIGLRFAKRNEADRAALILAASLQHLTAIDDSFQQAEALINLAVTYVKAGLEPSETDNELVLDLLHKFK